MSQWQDNNLYQWVDTEGPQWQPYSDVTDQLNQIWSDAEYVYAVTTSGLAVTEIESESLYAYAGFSGGYTTVWANNTQLFLGTENAGVRTINKSNITGSIVSPTDISSNINNYLDDNYLTSNNITYIHGYDDRFVCCTASGIDVVKLNPFGYVNSTTEDIAYKCFMTSGQSFYYTTTSGSDYIINRVDRYKSDWTAADVMYKTGTSWLPEYAEVKDIFVTTNTSSVSGYNTIFAATTSGVCIYDEGSTTTIIYTTNSMLAGSSDDITSVWADSDASLNNGKLYAASVGYGAAFSIIDMTTQSLFDHYTLYFAGRAGETLNADDVEDLNIVLGS